MITDEEIMRLAVKCEIATETISKPYLASIRAFAEHFYQLGRQHKLEICEECSNCAALKMANTYDRAPISVGAACSGGLIAYGAGGPALDAAPKPITCKIEWKELD